MVGNGLGAYVLVFGSMISLWPKRLYYEPFIFRFSLILLFVYVIVYVFDPILSKKEFDDITKKNDTFVRKMFLLKQKSELELDLDIGNINLNEYKKEEIELNKKLNKLNLD